MGEKGMSILLESLKKINDKILSIMLYDEEKYNVFARRAEEIEKRLIEIDDENEKPDDNIEKNLKVKDLK